jgi:disulfide oxidoreductase YuzD
MRFGETVRVEYVELADGNAQEKFGDLLLFAEERDLAYPLVAINGELRLAGSAHYFQILPLVEAVLAESPVVPQEATPSSS